MDLKQSLLVGVAVSAVAVTVGRCYDSRLSEWEARVERVEHQVQRETARADSLKNVAKERVARADSLASLLRTRAPKIRERIVRVREETPDSLAEHPAIVKRDSIIEGLREESDGWRRAFEEQARARIALEDALRTTEASRDSLSAVLSDRPSEKPWWVPEVVVGPSAGITTTGQPYAGAGVTLGWKVKL